MAEIGVPLETGDYTADVVVIDSGDGTTRRGGHSSFKLSVPDLSRGIALSTPLFGRAILNGSDPSLEIVASTGEDIDFVYGSRRIPPVIGSKPLFKKGEWLALYVQVYNSTSAEVRYDLVQRGKVVGSLDSETIRAGGTASQQGMESIQFVKVDPAWPKGSYSFRITAKDLDQDMDVTKEAKFRVIE